VANAFEAVPIPAWLVGDKSMCTEKPASSRLRSRGISRYTRRTLLISSLVSGIAGASVGCQSIAPQPLPPGQPSPRLGTSDAITSPLPPLPATGGPSVEAAIAARRSVRNYADRPVTLEQLARLLHYTTGVTDPEHGFRAAPSAGALYPIEVYPVIFRVEGIAPGVYHYLVGQHALALVRAGDIRSDMQRAALFQSMITTAALVLVLTGVPARSTGKYGERGQRYLLLEAGHIGENAYLEATTLGLGCCAIGAFLDAEVDRLLGVDGRAETSVFMLALGPLGTASHLQAIG